MTPEPSVSSYEISRPASYVDTGNGHFPLLCSLTVRLFKKKRRKAIAFRSPSSCLFDLRDYPLRSWDLSPSVSRSDAWSFPGEMKPQSFCLRVSFWDFKNLPLRRLELDLRGLSCDSRLYFGMNLLPMSRSSRKRGYHSAPVRHRLLPRYAFFTSSFSESSLAPPCNTTLPIAST